MCRWGRRFVRLSGTEAGSGSNDIRMNQVDGIQATKQIKTADHAAKIIMLTDYDDDALRQAAMRAGACAYALKDHLLDLVRLIDSLQQDGRVTD